jgi:competence protein ComEC
MRKLLLTLISIWLIGILIGLIRPEFSWVLGGFIIAGSVVMKARLQVAAVCLILLLLGSVYGFSAQLSLKTSLGRCDSSERSRTGIIQENPTVKVSSIDYVVRDEKGCGFIVSAPTESVFHKGDIIKFEGKWQTIDEIAKNSPGYADYLRRQRIFAVVRYPTLTLEEDSSSSYPIHEFKRERVQRTLSEPEASLALGMIFNEAGLIPASVLEDFRTTGLSHVLAISGSNITLIAGMLFGLSFLLPVSGRTRVIIVSGLLWLYVAFIGWPVSALRAVFFWTLALFGFHLRSLVGFGTVSLLTAVCMVTIDPLVLYDVGFQLSLSAVIGIVCALLIGKPLIERRRFASLWQVLFITVGATLFTWPLSIYHFGTFSLIGIVANVIVLPLLSLLYVFLLVVVLISFIIPPLALLPAFGVHVLWRLIDWITRVLTLIPGGYFEDVHLSGWVVLLCYVVLLSVVTFSLYFQKRSWREIWA